MTPDKTVREHGSTPLDALVAIDRLDVGPPRIEPRRITVPYAVRRGRARGSAPDTLDLVYKWEEDVFDPADEASQNLAAVIGAQLALNYGLFCKRIAFHGLFDESDRRFIGEMMDNTSREIYVKKFLEPNPFLVGDAAHVALVKRKSYTHARLDFPDARGGKSRPLWQLWNTDHARHAILSSGGKDSLLSYGLLDELERETHPIFVNESGRHWFTALNAYRYFEHNVPNTRRVWMNSDRVFSWMLRHLPFIRQDFQNVRADEYPVRLWTVALFVFGGLPLVRKHGLGRIVIGDEYDTTNRTSYRGIPHYDGLFDQSRYFDAFMSRYYLRKGWATSQFSLLRPLSEMLIEKTLVERYPAIQQHQVSCHAASKDGERVRPCGKCEKCRRIVGMLSAIGGDPKRCGYTDEQIADCLKSLAELGVHQEAPGAAHLEYLLDRRGLAPVGPERKKRLKAHTEVMRLRFDSRHARLDDIPVDLRKPLYSIFLAHADGALVRTRREWTAFDPLSDPGVDAPYVYEVQSDKAYAGRTGRANLGQTHIWGEMTWPEAQRRLSRIDVALLPVGAVEQHGPHLPLDTDAFDADYMARRVAEACSHPQPFVLPLIAYGVSYHHEDFYGTVSVANDTLSRMVYDIGMSMAKNGVRKLVIINGHGGNAPTLNYAAQMINRDARIFVCVDTGETSDVDVNQLIATPNDVHAGEIETSTSLATRPHLVRMDEARPAVPKFSSRYLDFTSLRGVPWHAYTHKVSPTGVMGDPTKASAEKGRRIWELMIAHMVAFVEDLKRMTLEEIYQRKY